jgi:hypothetical protein
MNGMSSHDHRFLIKPQRMHFVVFREEPLPPLACAGSVSIEQRVVQQTANAVHKIYDRVLQGLCNPYTDP